MLGATNMSNPFLIGDRIYLRPLDTETDLDRCLRWINDPEVLATLGRRQPMGRVAEKEWLQGQYKNDSHMTLAIVLKDGDRHIGNCGFNEIDYVNRNAVFGILIGEKDVWGRGYGPDAARLILQHGFEELGLHRIGLEVYSLNPRAIRAYEKAGFVREGTLRESYFRHGQFHDTIVMSILESEWSGP
jgi:RimJ/RimL family protein N-acetyltransferase